MPPAPAPVWASAPVAVPLPFQRGLSTATAYPPGPIWPTRPVFAPPPFPPPPLPPPTPKHSALRWLVVGICALLILAFASIGTIVAVSGGAGPDQGSAAWRTPAAAIAAPAQNAPASEWSDWAKRAVDNAVKDQAQGLLAGDENRFLAPVDPADEELLAGLKQRFRVLTRMGLGQWSQTLRSAPKATSDRTWHADIKISYCFGDNTCRSVMLIVGSEWTFRNDRLVMTDLDTSGSDQLGPRPWETDELSVNVGARVVVAGSVSNANLVAKAAIAADKAAKVADTLAKWEAPPNRYVIFLAGTRDWGTWYGHEQPPWAAAWAVPVSSSVTEVMVYTRAVKPDGLEQLLTHELTHATTLAGKRDGINASSWWLVEGIADYATMIGKSIGEYDALGETRAFVQGKWDGDPVVRPPTTDASIEDASARYGVAFLAVRRISDVYGQDKMLDFFGKIVHDNLTAETASAQALGLDWTTVKADCARFIRGAVG